jgi:hypothetical protein
MSQKITTPKPPKKIIMNKIIRIALSTKFSEEIIGTLENIIANTPNPEHATALLLGIYEEPNFEETHKIIYDKACVFTEYDPWTERVHYEYVKEKEIDFYIHADTDTSLITRNNYEDFKIKYSSSNCKSFSIKTGEMIKRQDYCSIDVWNKAVKHAENLNQMQA